MVLDTKGSVLIRSILKVYVGMWLELYCKLALKGYLLNIELLGHGVTSKGLSNGGICGRLELINGGSVCVEYASWHGLLRILAHFHRNVLLAIRIYYLV